MQTLHVKTWSVLPLLTKRKQARVSHMRSSKKKSIAEVFSYNYRLLAALNQAGFRSVVPLMMLPREALMEISGIGMSSAVRITRTLTKHNLGQHNICERMSTFLEEQFGSIEEVPLSALQITVVREEIINRPVFAPLELISLLEVLYPDFTIGDLVKMTRDEVRAVVQSNVSVGVELHDLGEDIKHVAIRLGNFDLQLADTSSRELLPVS